LLYTKILEGLQQKLEGLEPFSPITGAATASDVADQQLKQLDLGPFDQALLTSIVESCWNLWRNYGHLIKRLGSCVLNQLDILGWYKDVSIFSNCWHITWGKSSGV